MAAGHSPLRPARPESTLPRAMTALVFLIATAAMVLAWRGKHRHAVILFMLALLLGAIMIRPFMTINEKLSF